ncbi:ABC transporter permease [Spirosoma soli]|uniref:ABC transporter permease n=1 Tax=Spirosoma soli TaxID=1770529 RepID=A0ABW5M3B5_9BACT
MLQNYLKIAVRNLWRSPLFSVLNIGGLALGIGCCLLIALYVYDEWNYDRFHTNANNIYRVVEKQTQAGEVYDVAVTPGPLAPTLKSDFPEVVNVGRLGKWSGIVKHGKQTFEENSLYFADNGLLKLFDFPLLKGNPNTVLTGPDELVMTEAAAIKYFGADWQRNPNVLGTLLRLNNERDYKVTGILKNIPPNSHLQFDILLSFKNIELFDKWGYQWNSNNYHTYVQLREGTVASAFNEKIKKHIQRYKPSAETTLCLQPLTDIYLRSKFAFNTDNWGKRSDIFYVKLFGAVGLIVLLIACINFINLSTARSMRRAREVGVRKTMGAYRWHLIFQFLGESLLIVMLAVLASQVLAQALMPVFNELSGKDLTLNYDAWPLWLSLLTLTLLVSLVAGIYPAFLLSSFQPAKVFKRVFSVPTGKVFRQSLVIGQFALSVALIVCTLLIYRQLQYMQRKNLGFDKSQLLYVRMGGALKQKAAQFKEELLKQSGIEAAAATTATLVDVGNESNITWEGQQPKDEFLITQVNVDPDFLSTVGMKLVRGENFRKKTAADTNWTYLINETAARRMGYTNQSALNKRVEFWGMKGRIAGVIRDFHFRPLSVPIAPLILRYAPGDFFTMLVKTRPGQAQQAIQTISQLYTQYEKETPFKFGFIDQELDKQYRREQRTGQIVLYFSGFAILISCLGLFGLTAFTAEQRTKEIGVRKVLGASVVNIVGLLSKDFLKLVVIAIIIATPLAWYAMHEWLQSFAYKITIEWWVFVLAGLLAVGIALLTISFQSVKAALTNPVKSLRTE